MDNGDIDYLNHIDLFSEAVVVIGDDGIIESVNPSAGKLFGRTAAELKQHSFLNFLYADERESFMAFLNAPMQQPICYGTFMLAKGQQYFLGNVKLTRVARGAQSLLLLTISNALETSLKNLTLHFDIHKLLDSNREFSIACFVKNKAGRYAAFNRSFSTHLGVPESLVLGRSDSELLPAQIATAYQESDALVLQSGQFSERYHWHSLIEGGQRFYYTVKYPLINEINETIGLVGVSFDITDNHVLLEQFMHERFKNLSISHSSKIGYVHHKLICDAEGNPVDYVFLDMNKTYEALTGLRYESVIGRSVLEVLPNTEAYWIELYGEVALTGKSRSFENYSKALGKTFAVEAFQTEPGFFCVLVQDITGVKSIEERLLSAYADADQANRTKEQFLMNMSHEMRTPLNGIKGVLELMSMTKMSEELSRLHHVLTSSFLSLSVVLTEIIEYTELTKGHDKLYKAQFDLRALLKELEDYFAAAALQKGLSFKVHFSSECSQWYRGDRVKLKQLLANIIGNAVKFTTFGGIDIEVTCTPVKDIVSAVQIVISDTGIGMSPEDQNQIFELFQQKSAGIDKAYRGLGLGLTLSKEICVKMDAQMEVTSALGKGSRFVITVPLEATEEVPSKTRSDLPGKVLIVEDDPVSGVLLEMMLKSEGYSTTIVSNGFEALKLLEGEAVDLILMDIDLPEIDGIETTRIFKSTRPEARKIPVIAVTGYATEENRRRSFEVGMSDFVPKPVVKLDILKMLTKWL